MTHHVRFVVAAHGQEVDVTAEWQQDTNAKPTTWFRLVEHASGRYLGEHTVTGFKSETGLRPLVVGMLESIHQASAHLATMADTATVSYGGRFLHVTTDFSLDDAAQPITILTVLDADTGDVLVDREVRKGWLTNDRLSQALHFIVHGGKSLVLDTTDFRWVNVTLHGDGGVCGHYCEPTESGLAEASYDFDSHRVQKIHVRALCSEWQQEVITNVLLAYWTSMRQRMPVGNDRVCLHDTAFEPTHDGECILVAWGQFAAALQVEVQALLAEPQPEVRT